MDAFEFATNPEHCRDNTLISGSSFFDAILGLHCGVGGTTTLPAVIGKYEDCRKSLELHYDVTITQHSVQAAHEIVERFPLFKVGVADLLVMASVKLRNDFFSDSEKKDLDMYEFLYARAFVESRAIMKEKKYRYNNLIHPQVKEELEEVKYALGAFMKCWPSEYEISGSVARELKTLHNGFNNILSLANTEGNMGKAIQDLQGPFSALLDNINARFRRCLTVTPRIVGEVASSMLLVPRNFLPPSSQLPVELITKKMSRRLVGLDNQLWTIINSISSRKPGPRPLSFLLLGPPGHGKTALAEALAVEMFDSKFVRYDAANFTPENFIVQLLVDPGSQLISSCVVMFDNIDNTDAIVIDNILQILKDGTYVDDSGRRIAFLNVLILLTSKVELPICRCARLLWGASFQPPFKEVLKSGWEVQGHVCKLQNCLTDAEKKIKPQFFDSLDDVVVFPVLSASHLCSIFWLEFRNAVSKAIVCPYASAFQHVWRTKVAKSLKEGGGHVVKQIVAELVSNLSSLDDESIVYVDELICNSELSYRIQKMSDIRVVHDFKMFKDALAKSRMGYQNEKDQVKQIFKLRAAYLSLVEMLDSKDKDSLVDSVQELLATVNCLLARPSNSKEKKPVQAVCVPHGVDDVSVSVMSRMFTKMQSKWDEQVVAVQVIAKALMMCIHRHCNEVASFLSLGPTDMDQRQLMVALSNYLVADDGTVMLVEVDLSNCTNSVFSCTCKDGRLLKDVILERSHNVLVFTSLELANLCVFTNIISILDHGLLMDDDGSAVDFRKCVIVFISNLGNKRVIAKLVGGESGYDGTIDKAPKGFRSEILNRVDEILLFNGHLLHGARLPMKEGLHLDSYDIYSALSCLFDNGIRVVDTFNTAAIVMEEVFVCILKGGLLFDSQ